LAIEQNWFAATKRTLTATDIYVVALHLVIAALVGAWLLHRTLSPMREPVKPLDPGGTVRSQQLAGQIAFVGDSRVSMLAATNVAPNSENFGVGGQDLRDLAVQLKALDLQGASAIVLESGLDDWWRDRLSNIGPHYATALAALPTAKPVVASAILPVNPDQAWRTFDGRYDLHGIEPALAAANAEIARQCAARAGCVFVPVPSALLAGPDLNPAYSLDGLHLNPAGDAIWAASLRQVVSRLPKT